MAMLGIYPGIPHLRFLLSYFCLRSLSSDVRPLTAALLVSEFSSGGFGLIFRRPVDDRDFAGADVGVWQKARGEVFRTRCDAGLGAVLVGDSDYDGGRHICFEFDVAQPRASANGGGPLWLQSLRSVAALAELGR